MKAQCDINTGRAEDHWFDDALDMTEAHPDHPDHDEGVDYEPDD